MTEAQAGEAGRIAAIVRKRFAAIADDPEERYRYAEGFYDSNPVPGPDWYGRSELAFMRWEIERGVLNPPQQRVRPGSPWWRSVNGQILRDQDEGSMLAAAGIEGDNPAANRWSTYLREPSPMSWYRAHNASVVSGYVRAAALATRERPAEQFLMNLVLARVLFAQALAEEAAFAVDGHPLFAAFLSDPRLPAVSIVMQVPDFYPRCYPLDPGEEALLERRAHTHNEEDVSPIDADPCSHLEDLFAFAGTSLGDDLSRFLDRGIVCYPHGVLGVQTLPPIDGRVWLPWLAHDTGAYQGRWTDTLLDEMRCVADLEADDVVKQYFNEFGGGPHEFFQALVAKPDPRPEECSPQVAEFLTARPPLPTWAHKELLLRGEEFFGQWGMYVPLVLICSSLPECYGAAKGVQVLHLTARLATDTRRRIVETAQMVLDVMAPGGMEIDAPGYRTVRRVRLMHAGVRYLIENDPRIGRDVTDGHIGPRWSSDWGVPINQEDLAGTLTTFSWSVLAGLRSLGVPVSTKDAEAYLHAWNVVGSMMGVVEEMLPENYEDAELLAHRIRERQWKASPEGREMTRALVEMLNESRPGKMIPGFSGTMIRHFVGDKLADDLGVPRGGRAGSIVRRASTIAIAGGLAQQHSRTARRLAGMVSRALLNSYTTFDRGEGRATFEIPTHLADAWNIRPARTR